MTTTTITTLMTVLSQSDGANFIQKEKYLRAHLQSSHGANVKCYKKEEKLSNIYPTV